MFGKMIATVLFCCLLVGIVFYCVNSRAGKCIVTSPSQLVGGYIQSRGAYETTPSLYRLCYNGTTMHSGESCNICMTTTQQDYDEKMASLNNVGE